MKRAMNSWWVGLLVLAAGCATPQTASLTTPDGTLTGRLKGSTRSFLGIPFAKPPTNELRFAPPVQNEAWAGQRDATVAQPRCLQLLVDQSGVLEGSAEDCLYLNVYTPRVITRPLPVMLYFPGGAYIIGGADEPMFEGSKLSRAEDVVVVTANYRLGPLGFMTHPSLRAMDAQNTGNSALLDQREAMRWVQRNIGAFGGDKTRVTLFGESAGAGSVCMHLLSEASAAFFQSAIMESAPCTAYPLPSAVEADAQGSALAAALGCTGTDPEVVRCLRQHDALDVVRALPLNTNVVFGDGVSWGPTVDGNVVAAQPLALFRAGKSANVPIIVGANADEGSIFFAKASNLKTEADVRAALGDLFRPQIVDAVVAHYGLAPSPRAVGERILGDIFFCDSRRIARAHAAFDRPVYRYYFARSFFDIVLGLGAFHGAEMPFLWDNSVQGLSVQPAGQRLKKAMQGYWASLVRTGDPNGGERPEWPRYQKAGDRVLRLDVPISEETMLRAADCDFWDSQLE